MFVAQCKNKIESEESSDEEVVSFTRRIINRISSNSDSDEESYANEDLEEMLEELAITEEEESTNAVYEKNLEDDLKAILQAILRDS
ncbi:hypothetical protein WN51_07136 [Melipona quadrifasciata]|uniref:Uncharacterized protein n=1 Tax=Melipona quadrifasciata TaxID=166423 RepID=A0A0N0U3K5_9HYME|nr:hypothetical protein WN51_07136 [Melipona quadrifasciata]